MAQTIAQIKKDMTDRFIASPDVVAQYQLVPGKTFADEFSAVSLESILFDVFAFCAWVLQKMFDQHRVDVDAALLAMKAHTLRWYVWKALLFQFGGNLLPDDDVYDNTGLTAAQVAAQKVVKYAAAIEVPKGLRLKVAGEANGDLVPLTAAQLSALNTYVQRIKDAGVKVYCESNAADSLKLDMTVYYDPLILDVAGARLDGTDATPVQNAVRDFLQTGMPFSGLFVREKLVDALQAVDGVVIPDVNAIAARYGALAWAAVDAQYLPDAGWLRIAPADLTLQFLPHEPL